MTLSFHWSDYLVLVLSLLFSAFVGVAQGGVDMRRRKKSMKKGEPLVIRKLERNISVWPASLSVVASTLAAPFVIGVPAEIYSYGSQFVFLIIGLQIGVLTVTHFLYSRFYDLEIASIYEFLEFRFSKSVRSQCSAIFAFSLLIYIGIITYAPALVFSKMTNMPITWSVLGVGMIGIVYTTIGGLKGVIWVDAIQMLIILTSLLSIITMGTSQAGGVQRVFKVGLEDQRIQLPNYDLNPHSRHTFWTQSIGGSITTLVVFSNQAIVQKFVGIPSKKKMFLTAYLSLGFSSIFFLLFVIVGVVMYAYYEACSPLTTGLVTKPDELLPLYVLQIFNGYYGMAGLFTAGVFSASLSSMAGAINALAVVTLLDVVNPIHDRLNGGRPIGGNKTILILKLLVVLYGLLTIVIAYLAPLLGEGLLNLSLMLLNVVGTPLLAVFLMGVFMPWINSKGVSAGLFVSLFLVICILLGGASTAKKYMLPQRRMLPLFDKRCNSSLSLNFTSVRMPILKNSVTNNNTFPEPGSVENLLVISYMWYPLIGLLISFIAAFVISAFTGFRRGEPVHTDLSWTCCYRKKDKFLKKHDDINKLKEIRKNKKRVKDKMGLEKVDLVSFKNLPDSNWV